MKDIFLAFFKILGFIFLAPSIAASFLVLQQQVLGLPVYKEACLLWGIGGYILFHFFIYDFKPVFMFGYGVLNKMFGFFPPLAHVMGYVVPFYTLVLIVIGGVALVAGKLAMVEAYILFGIGFTLTMHVVMTAREAYEEDSALLKAHYLLTYGLVFVANLFIMALILAWVVPEFSFASYLKSLISQTSHLYQSTYTFLFVDSST